MSKVERHRAISDAFADWLDRPAHERATFIAALHARDGDVAREVEALIEAEAASGDFLEDPIGTPDTDQHRSVDDPMIGRRLGAYRVSAAIGYGGMGAVYLAVRDDAQFEQRVAIKVIRAGLDPRAAASFRRERQILASLSHPYIAHLIDGGETDGGDPYLVMEYVEGGPLTQHGDAAGLDVRQRLQLFLKVCEAVQFAHQHLIVHRDITPANILVTADGVPKLLDFGIARMMQAADSAAAPLAKTLPLLTPDYASPEQARGEVVTTASDVYSLGVVLYELLVRARPDRRIDTTSDVYAVLEAIREEDPQRPTDAIKGRPEALSLDADIDAIVLKTLRKQPAERYGSVEQLAQDLERYLDGQPIRARQASTFYLFRKFVTRHRAAVAASVIVAMSLIAATAVSRRQAAMAEAERVRAEQRFNDVRQLANAFVFEFDQSIQSLPGATAARRLAIARGLEYLERLTTDATDAPLLRELAAGDQRVAEVQGNPYFANLGDLEGASKSYHRAIELRERVLTIEGGSDVDRAGHASAIHGQGDLLWAGGDFEGALREYQRALGINGALTSANPDNPDYAYAVSRNEYFSGQALTKLGRFDEALQRYRRALAGYEGIATRHPDRGEFQRVVAVAAMKVGDCRGRAGDWKAAQAQYERGVTLLEGLVKAHPDVTAFARLQAFLLNRAALALAGVGDLSTAYRRATGAVAGAENLSRADSGDRQVRGDRAAYLSTLGQIALLLARAADAERALATAEAIFSELERTGSVSVDQRSERGVALRRLGDVARRAGRSEEALDRYRQALAPLERTPRDLEYEAELAVVLMRLGESSKTDPKPWLKRSLEVWRSAEGRGVRASRLQPGGTAQLEALLR